MMDELHSYVEENCANIRQIVALKNGETVYEDYWRDFKPHDALRVMSVTKSVVSLLIGIARDKGLIGGNVLYINPDNHSVVAVTGAFKPMVLDRVQFIRKHIDPLLGD